MDLALRTKAIVRRNELKARAGIAWCESATAHELANGGKPWRYLLIPHNAIGDNSTMAGLVRQFERKNPLGE